MNEKFVFVLGFQTDHGKIASIRLTGANPSVDAVEIKSAMLDVISSDVYITKNGSPAFPHSAVLVTTETETIDVA